MLGIDVVRRISVDESSRMKQINGLFDVPQTTEIKREWKGEIDLDINADDWNIGLIVGPSGSGKSTIAKELFGDLVDVALSWNKSSVIDDFDLSLSTEKIAEVCQAVGFNTIPSWKKPYDVLSTGEKFRVSLARRLIEGGDLIVVDEFSSVVDRQVARIGSYATQKFTRRNNKKFVAVTCHYDVAEWLDPDWILEPETMNFKRVRLRRIPKGSRPEINVKIRAVDRSAWKLFSRYHYLTANVSVSAKAFCLFVDDNPAAIAMMMHQPISSRPGITKPGIIIYYVSRLVCLPDYQGLGFGPLLSDTICSAFSSIGYETRTYPAHPSLIRTYAKSKNYQCVRRAGSFHGSKRKKDGRFFQAGLGMGGRPCAVFKYVGEKMKIKEALELLAPNYPKLVNEFINR